MRRWICPGCGSGANAPERPRKDDVRRYCLACSAETGFLVERTAPALERKRAAAKTASAARSAVKLERERERKRKRYTVTLPDANGVERELDVRVELKQALTAMGFFEGWARGRRPTIDEIDMTVRRGHKEHHSGHAWGAFRVAFTFGQGGGDAASYEAGLEVVYHEAAHLADSCEHHHGPEFHRILADALQKRWPWIVYGGLNRRESCWAMGQNVIRQMCDHVRAGGEL